MMKREVLTCSIKDEKEKDMITKLSNTLAFSFSDPVRNWCILQLAFMENLEPLDCHSSVKFHY